MTTADELAKLHQLHVQGAITAEEFAAQKAKLMGEATPIATAAPAPQVERKTSTLAVLAFVFSFIIGPIGSLLGIIAIIVVATSKGKLRGIGFGIGAICVGLFFWGILAAVAIPACSNYMAKAKTSEATLNIDRIFEGAVSYYDAEHVTPNGILTHQFPASTEWTPSTPCCLQPGGKCDAAAVASEFDTPTWKALDFAMGDNFYYQYQFVVEGQTAYARAQGDLDCDGTFSLFERSMEVTLDGTVLGSSGVYKLDPLE